MQNNNTLLMNKEKKWSDFILENVFKLVKMVHAKILAKNQMMTKAICLVFRMMDNKRLKWIKMVKIRNKNQKKKKKKNSKTNK